jgi:ABC-type polar amino acid transport system ATPase subunit
MVARREPVRGEVPERDPGTTVRLLNVTKRRNGQTVLDHVTLDLREGECVVVCGQSGSGKTTLLRAIAGLDPIDEGEIWIGGHVRNRVARAKLRGGEIAMVFQGEQLYSHLTLLANLVLGPTRVLKHDRAEARARALELLASIGLSQLSSRFPHELSGGERQRGAIARALMMTPRLVLFDEPTSALDPSCVKEVLSLIYQLHERGQTMILVTHETGFARMIADRIVCMDSGRIREVGLPHQIIVAPRHGVTRRLFGDTLHEISALDRVVYAESVNVGHFLDKDAELLSLAPFLQNLAASLCCNITPRKVKRGDIALQLRMGIADLVVSPSRVEHEAERLTAFSFECGGQAYFAYANPLDSVWVRTLTKVAEKQPVWSPALAEAADHARTASQSGR